MLLPASFQRTHAEAVAEEVESAAGTTPEERGRILLALCRMAVEQISQHQDPQRTLDYQDPIPASTEVALKRLRAQHERRHTASGA
jgi:hypothetical protein